MTENQIPYEQEEEINLVSLLFTVLHKYRQMAAAALVCAGTAGSFCCLFYFFYLCTVGIVCYEPDRILV